MIAYLRGTLLEASDKACLLLTSGGVGYEVFLTTPALSRLPAKGEPLELFTHALLRVGAAGQESVFALFGFETLEERQVFETLLDAPKLGPRKALAVLSIFSPDELRQVVQAEDVAGLSRVPGLGKKTAQQVLFDLKFKLKAPVLAPRKGQAPAARAPLQDALAGLLNLGYAEDEVLPILARVFEAEPDLDTAQALREALKAIAKSRS